MAKLTSAVVVALPPRDENNLIQNLDVIFDYINFIDVGSNGGGINLANTNITARQLGF